MKVSPRSVGFIALGLVVGLTLGAVGVSAATSDDSGVKACASKKGVLVMPSATGKCPGKTTAVKLGARGPAGPAGVTGTTYLGSSVASLTIPAEDCAAVDLIGNGLKVGDTALIVPDYSDYSEWVVISSGVVKAADHVVASICNHSGSQVSLPGKTYYVWRIKK